MSERDSRAVTLASLGEGGSAATVQEAKSWEKFSQWVCCMCVVTFDLELGQAMEVRIRTQGSQEEGAMSLASLVFVSTMLEL